MGSDFVFDVSPFYFLRHGETRESQAGILQGQVDTALSATGRKTAEDAGQRMIGHDLGSIYASPLQRAWTTASIVSVLTGAPRYPLPGLMERCWGIYEGRPKSERPRTPNPESVETLEAFSARVVAAMRSISGPSPVLVIAHSGVFRVLCQHFGFEMDMTTSISSADLVFLTPPKNGQTRWHINAVNG